jgi:hypothetical protein
MLGTRRLSLGLCLAALAAVIAAMPATAQNASLKRLADGHPDLQGIWTNVSLTTLERSSRYSGVVVTAAEAKAREAQVAAGNAAGARPTDPRQGAPTDRNSAAGYNSFWIDSGTRLGVVRGETRSAWIVDPKDGRVPYTPEAKKTFEKLHAKANGDFDGPEGRTPADRCIVGFGSSGGPPMMNVMYNNNYQIVQTPDHLMILVEMNHDARIIPIRSGHGPAAVSNWMGDSSAHWDGDTLVVETVNVDQRNTMRATGAQSFYLGPNPRITERFTRVSENEMLYEFQVEEPTAFAQPWRAEMPMFLAKGPIYEYACHEGNYALPGMLAGARRFDGEGKSSVMNYYAKEAR